MKELTTKCLSFESVCDIVQSIARNDNLNSHTRLLTIQQLLEELTDEKEGSS